MEQAKAVLTDLEYAPDPYACTGAPTRSPS
jgi:hypothetical protein